MALVCSEAFPLEEVACGKARAGAIVATERDLLISAVLPIRFPAPAPSN